MAGKYAHLIDKLPRLLGTEPKYQEKVEVVKQEMLTVRDDAGEPVEIKSFLPATVLGKQYIDIRDEIDALEARLSDANLRLEATSQLMTAQFEVEDVSSLNFTGKGVVRTQYEPYAKVEDKEAFRLWCIHRCQTCGHDDVQHPVTKNGFLVCERPATLEGSLALPWQSTNMITKERLLAGQPEPAGVVAHAKVKIVLTREK